MSMPVPQGEVLKISQQVTHTQASARGFAGVGRADPFLGCSDAVIKQSKCVECCGMSGNS